MPVDDDSTLTRDPDGALLAGLLIARSQAFAELVRRHGAALLRHARTFVQGDAAAEDVLQETWLAVVTGVEHFRGHALLRTWLYAIVANRARTRAQRERHSVPFSSLAGGDFHPVDRCLLPGEQAEVAETLALVRAAIESLPPVQREVVRLRDVEGWDAIEVCSALALSTGNQRVLLHRGRTRVRCAFTAAP